MMNILVTGACGQLGNEMQLQAQQNQQHRWFFTDVAAPPSSPRPAVGGLPAFSHTKASSPRPADGGLPASSHSSASSPRPAVGGLPASSHSSASSLRSADGGLPASSHSSASSLRSADGGLPASSHSSASSLRSADGGLPAVAPPAVAALDITDRAAVAAFVEANAIDIIVNCAAYTAVDRAEADEERAHLLNATAPGYLAEAIERRGGQLIQISTDYVFDGTAHTPYTEDQPTSPASAYGRTKLEGENAVLAVNPSAMIIRTAWLYSRFGNNFVKTMLRLGRERTELGVVFDQIGTPTYARDLATAITTAINQGIQPGVYHFTDEGVTSWYDFTIAIHRLAGITTCRVRPLHTAEYPTPAARPHYSALDKSKIKHTYGIDIPHWEASLEACIKELMPE